MTNLPSSFFTSSLIICLVFTGLGFATEDDLVTFAMAENDTTQQMWGGICFTSEFPNGDFAEDIHYKVCLYQAITNIFDLYISKKPFYYPETDHSELNIQKCSILY